MAREKNVHILVIPPHTSHRIQPLDVSFMKPLSTYYEQEVRTWLRNNPGKVVTIHDVSSLFGRAYPRAATPQISISAFLHTGICPFNANIFPDHYFAPSETTDRVLVDDNDVSSSQPSNLLRSVDPQSHLSPEDIKPIPKVAPVTQVRHKTKRGKTMVLTATPNVQELRDQKWATLRPNFKRVKKTLTNVFNKESSIQKKIKEIKAAKKTVVISSESDSDDFFEDCSSDEYEPTLQSKSKRVKSMFSAIGKNKLVKEPKKAKRGSALLLNKNLFTPILPADTPSTSIIPEIPSVSNKPKKKPGDKEEACYCFVCEQDEVKDMRLYINC